MKPSQAKVKKANETFRDTRVSSEEVIVVFTSSTSPATTMLKVSREYTIVANPTATKLE